MMSEHKTIKTSTPNILIIDDDEAIRDTLQAALFKTGYNLFMAEDGETGLAMVGTCKPDLILLDVMMPRMNGFEFCRLLRDDPCFAEIPVIMITALHDQESKLEGLDAGADDFVSKPWSKAELLARVGTTVKLNRYRKLFEEREKFDQVVRLVPESIAIIDEQGQLLFANPAFADLFGSASDMGQEGMLAHIPSELQGYAVQQIKTIITAIETADNEHLLSCKDQAGSTLWIALRGTIIDIDARPALLVAVHDVTEDVLARQALEQDNEEMLQENIKLRTAIRDQSQFCEIIGESSAIQEIFETIERASASKASVVLCGESGTGKELVAQEIHAFCSQNKSPFVPVNCGSITESLFESEFFGYKKGAFTDAHADKSGFLHEANGGTLFLDEVGEISLGGQVSLLRVIENGTYTPVGDSRQLQSNFRLIAATNRDLQEHVTKGLMREDFFYRINVIPIAIPALRERKEDIPLLCEHFLELYNTDKKPPLIPAKTMDMLCNYEWPGNVRELQSVIQRFLVFGNFDFMDSNGPAGLEVADSQIDLNLDTLNLNTVMSVCEEHVIRKALTRNRWHRAATAKDLGVNPKTLYIKMKNMGLG